MYRNLTSALALLAIFSACYVNSEINFDQLDDEAADNTTQCEIFNVKYNTWFLIADQTIERAAKRSVSLGKYVVFSDIKQKSWKFLPVEGVKNGFHLKNNKYNEKLYASTNYLGFNPFTQKRRAVYTWRYSTDMQLEKNSFVWIVRKTEQNPEQYYIYNLAYREPLYAGSWGYKGSVFLWHDKHEDHDQFKWTLKCTKGKPLID